MHKRFIRFLGKTGSTAFLLLTIATLLLTGCAAPKPPLNTPSGNPEILIPNVTRKQAADALVGWLSSVGMTIRLINEYQLVVGQRADNDTMAKLLYGSKYDTVPEYRLSFTFVEEQRGVKVYSRAAIVTNPGSGFERVNDATDNTKHTQQAILVKLHDSLVSSSVNSSRIAAPLAPESGTAVPAKTSAATPPSPAAPSLPAKVDATKLDQLVPGKSTAADATMLFGPPHSTSNMVRNSKLLQWIEYREKSSAHIAILFDADDRMIRITHKSFINLP